MAHHPRPAHHNNTSQSSEAAGLKRSRTLGEETHRDGGLLEEPAAEEGGAAPRDPLDLCPPSTHTSVRPSALDCFTSEAHTLSSGRSLSPKQVFKVVDLTITMHFYDVLDSAHLSSVEGPEL